MSESTTAFGYLTMPEVRFLDAAVERLIPTDELGPGARDAGVTAYIDGQLLSSWGSHGRNYRSGPWPDGIPEQGFQSRFTPQEIYRIGIREINDHCVATQRKPFDQLSAEKQDGILMALEKGQIDLPSLPARLFFELLWRNTEEGFFADPLYGGNRDKVGWKLVGFPGVAAVYTTLVDKHGVPYNAEPVSIADMLEGRVAADEHGHPKHVTITRKE